MNKNVEAMFKAPEVFSSASFSRGMRMEALIVH